MLKRLYHSLIVGHRWVTESIAFNEGTKRMPEFYSLSLVCGMVAYQEDHCGFTEKVCACGETTVMRLIGDHREQARSDELAELRKMAGL